jgi:hypothetical protein
LFAKPRFQPTKVTQRQRNAAVVIARCGIRQLRLPIIGKRQVQELGNHCDLWRLYGNSFASPSSPTCEDDALFSLELRCYWEEAVLLPARCCKIKIIFPTCTQLSCVAQAFLLSKPATFCLAFQGKNQFEFVAAMIWNGFKRQREEECDVLLRKPHLDPRRSADGCVDLEFERMRLRCMRPRLDSYKNAIEVDDKRPETPQKAMPDRTRREFIRKRQTIQLLAAAIAPDVPNTAQKKV